jgi:small subunit ribosomal protein S6
VSTQAQQSASHLREYETIYVIKQDVEDQNAIAFMTKMKGIVEREGGKHLKMTNWGRRKLAWERNKQQKGMFIHHRYLGKPGLVAEYERTLAIEETIILRQSVLLDPSVDPAARQPEEDVLNPPIVKEREDKPRRFDDDGDDRYGGYDREFGGFGGRDFGGRDDFDAPGGEDDRE